MEELKERAICPKCKTNEFVKYRAMSGPCAKYDDNGQFIPFTEYVVTYHFDCHKCRKSIYVNIDCIESVFSE